MSWRIVYTGQAQKDAKKLSAGGLKAGAQELPDILAGDPFQRPPPFEKLVGDLAGAYVRFGNYVNAALDGQVLTIRPQVVSGSPTSPIAWTCGYRESPEGMEAVGEDRTTL